MNVSKILTIIILAVGGALTIYSQTPPAIDTQKLNTYLHSIHLNKGFNGELIVAQGNEILFQETVGLASYENEVELKKGAVYRIASLTKTFTASLIAIAQEEGKLDVQDNAHKYLPNLSPKFREIMIAQLLTHTSGLPHNEGIKEYWQVKSKLHLTPEQVLAEINALELLFQPGSKMSYSSLGYYLLALVLERIYHTDYDHILQDKILAKLHMTETGIGDNLAIIPHMTVGYHWVTDDSLVVAPYRNYSLLKGAGDMYSTATDLVKWGNSFYSHSLLSEKTTAPLFAPPINTPQTGRDSYGYGWYIHSEVPKKYDHGGGTWGYSSYLAIYPETQISIILLSNVSQLPVSSIASDLEKIVFEKPFQMPSSNVESTEQVELDRYIGTFISPSNHMKLMISKVKNRLYAKLGGNPPFEIYPKGNHQFFGKKVEVEFSFILNEGWVTGLQAERMGQRFAFEKRSD